MYLLKRILLFLPTLIVVSLVAFGLSKVAPGDPVACLGGAPPPGDNFKSDMQRAEKVYKETAQQLGLDKPAFYFGITSKAYPDTFYRILRQEKKATLDRLVGQYGNWQATETYFKALENLESATYDVPDSLKSNALIKVRTTVRDLYKIDNDEKVSLYLSRIEDAIFAKQLKNEQEIANPLALFLGKSVHELIEKYQKIKDNAPTHLLYIPAFHWYGFDNQYHNWLSKFLTGDFGISCIDRRPVADKLMDALFWTLILNSLAIFFAYLIAMPLGVFSAVKKDSRFDRLNSLVLFMLFSLPTFWVATMLVVFFTVPDYGMNIFLSIGLGNISSNAGFWERCTTVAGHLILPVFCLTYRSFAILSRQMRGGMLEVLQQDFIRTAKAKGLDSKTVIWKHAFRNALFPIITIFAAVFPAAIAGSVVIEIIFAIPGMGSLIFEAILARDWTVVYAVLMLGSILTMVGLLVSDVLYAVVDPRVKF